MEFNNLLKKIKHQESSPPKQFLALEITEEIVQAAVWQVKHNKTHLVSTGSIESLSQNDKPEDILKKIDTSLSYATQEIEEEPNEIIFGLPHSWVEEDSIKSTKKTLIKNICKELALQPLGFVVLTESLIRYLKIKEGTPLNAILARITDTEIIISQVKLGRVLNTHTVGRGTDICQDLEEGLSRFKSSQVFPSRIVIFNGNQDMEDIVQNLNSYDWQNKFEFLHLPKIEALPRESSISAIAVAGGSEVAKSIGFKIDFDQEPKQTTHQQPKALETKEKNPPKSPEDIGFVKEQDVREVFPQKPPQEASQRPNHPKPSLLSRLSSLFTGLSFSLPKPSFSFLSKLSTPILLFIPIGLLVLGTLAFAVFWFIPHASLTLHLEQKNLEEPLTLIVSQQASSIDQEKNLIPGKAIQKALSDSASTSTTGTKTIGETAQGKVTIYNRTFLEKDFQQGTELSYKNLTFTLDEPVTIASGSATSLGEAEVAVTAQNIGEEFNLEADTEFFVANFDKSSFAAQNSEAFTRGSSQEVQVVSKEDQETLFDDLTQKLLDQAKSKLQEEVDQQQSIFFQEESLEITKEEFSAEVGEEKSTLSLDLELKATGITYDKKDIETLINEKIQTAIPEGWERVDEPIQVKTNSSKQEEDNLLLDTIIKVKLIPDLETSELKTQIKGKNPSQLKPIFEKIPGYDHAEVLLTPQWLPDFLKKIPQNPQNISLETKST